MRKLLTILLLFVSLICSATNYYVKTGGNDALTGLSDAQAWATITKVNTFWAAGSFAPGDSINFNRGDTFYGTITVSESGTAGSPIIIGAYGTGADPIITGFTTITGWTNEGSGIYSKVITSEAQTNMVTIDGVNTGMGRYPDATYLTYESAITNTKITDTGLGDTPDWVGAQLVITHSGWIMDKCLITDHTGDVLTYENLGTNYNATLPGNYFIQNDLRCVTAYGEWYHDYSGTGKFYMYFGVVDPTIKTVKVATINNLVYNNSYDYITIDNLSFEGAIGSCIYFLGAANNVFVQNCSINFSGLDGIQSEYSITATFNNNIISNSNRDGILVYNGSYKTITNNTINNTGLIRGGTLRVDAIGAIHIFVESNDLIQYNNIDYSGRDGIWCCASNYNEIRNNFVNHAGQITEINDCGGIYTSIDGSTGTVIDRNVVINSGGEGIYLDESSENIAVTNNTVGNSSLSGIKLHKAHNITITNNTVYNGSYGIHLMNSTVTPNLYGIVMTGNIFFIAKVSGLVIRYSSPYITREIDNFGTINNNYYARPILDTYTMQVLDPTFNASKTLAEWQTYSSQDANSHKSPIAVADTSLIDFYYNATASNSVINLPVAMIDVKGNRYDPSITLLPYTSAVLMPGGTYYLKQGNKLMTSGGKLVTITH
jgi:parallel beta-helix repeat protein